jgi:serine/threonine-protein kinase
MSKQPDQRPGSAEELRRALVRCASGASSAAPPPTPAPKDRPGTPIWPWVIGLAIVAVVLGAIWLSGMVGDEGVTVPDVTGMALEDAHQALTAAGLQVGALTPDATATSTPQGTVLSQAPAAGEEVDEGSAVDLVVAGSGDVVVPDLTGLSQADAEAAIAAAGLVLETVLQDYSDEVPAGSVVEQTPAAGSTVPQGTAVTISVSTGPQSSPSASPSSPGAVAVPSVVGLTQADALAALQVAGFGAVTTTMASETVVAGKVMAQTPQAGVLAEPGTNVTLIVSTGPAASPTP